MELRASHTCSSKSKCSKWESWESHVAPRVVCTLAKLHCYLNECCHMPVRAWHCKWLIVQHEGYLVPHRFANCGFDQSRGDLGNGGTMFTPWSSLQIAFGNIKNDRGSRKKRVRGSSGWKCEPSVYQWTGSSWNCLSCTNCNASSAKTGWGLRNWSWSKRSAWGAMKLTGSSASKLSESMRGFSSSGKKTTVQHPARFWIWKASASGANFCFCCWVW